MTLHGRHERADAKIFIVFAKLGGGGFFIRIFSCEIDIALEYLRIEFKRVLHDLRYLSLSSSRSRVHESRIIARCIPSVRTKYPSINQKLPPAGGYQALQLPRDRPPTPEFLRHVLIGISCGKLKSLREGISQLAGQREPQALEMAARQGQSSVKAVMGKRRATSNSADDRSRTLGSK
jgi:hypothetical protein